MSAREVRVLTVPWSERLQGFDDTAVRRHLADRELLRAEPSFFVREGEPVCAVYVETRPLAEDRGQAEGQSAAGAASGGGDREPEAGEAEPSTLDERARARYERLRSWRRQWAEPWGSARGRSPLAGATGFRLT